MELSVRSFLFVFVIILCSSYCFANENSTKVKTDEPFLLDFIWKCSKSDDFGICIKQTASDYLSELITADEPLRINEYISLARNSENTTDREVVQSDGETEKTFAGNAEEKNEKLDRIIWNKLSSLFNKRTIQLSISPDVFQGRDKEGKILKKGHGFFLMAAMWGGMMLKMAFAKIAVIAGKALVLGKIALILSLILSLRRFLIRDDGNSEVVFTAADGGRSWKRNFKLNRKETGNDLAYNAYRHKN